MGNTQPKRSLSGKGFHSIWWIGFAFHFSCLTVQQAVILGKPVSFKVENISSTLDGTSAIYTAEIRGSGGVYEFHVRRGPDTEIYQLPSNKLTLLYEMEMGFKDIKRSVDHRYTRVTVNTHKSKRIYEINTDLIANFITGLKKK
jgi:hypothetical protein